MTPSAIPEMRCVNVVAVADVGCRVDLAIVSQRLDHTEYDPEHYYALIYRPPHATLSCLVNTSGKVVLTGAKAAAECEAAMESLAADLCSVGYDAIPGPISVKNLVFTGRMDGGVNLDRLRECPGFNVEYEPEQFPGSILRAVEPRGGAILLFRSGAFNVVGCTTAAQASGLLERLTHALHAAGIKP